MWQVIGSNHRRLSRRLQTARKHALSCTATELSTGFGTYLAQVSHISRGFRPMPLVVATNSCPRAVRVARSEKLKVGGSGPSQLATRCAGLEQPRPSLAWGPTLHKSASQLRNHAVRFEQD